MSNEIKPVTIPHEVADAIERLRRVDSGLTNEGIAHTYVTDSYIGPIAVNLRKIPFDTLMRALLDGYEREMTEEEKREQASADIAVRYARVLDGHSEYETSEEDSAYSDGMVYVLDALGIKIPGVSA